MSVLALALAVTLGSSPPLRTPELAQAEAQLAAGDFEDAVRSLQKPLKRPETTPEEKMEIFRLMGLAALYLGAEERAHQAYTLLLELNPRYELPKDSPPKTKALLTRVKEERAKRRPPVKASIRLLPPMPPTPGKPLELKAVIEGLADTHEARLFFRRGNAGSFRSRVFAPEATPGIFSAVVPADELPVQKEPYTLEVYAELTDASSKRLAAAGDASEPRRIIVK